MLICTALDTVIDLNFYLHSATDVLSYLEQLPTSQLPSKFNGYMHANVK